MMMADAAEAARAVQDAGTDIPDLAALRHATTRWAHQGVRPRVASGVEELDDLLAGGWSVGTVAEIVGLPCSGRTAVAAATVAATTARGEVTAWIEAGDAFDPQAAVRCGVVLERLLWVRAEGEEQAIRAAEIVLETGGVPVVVVDLAEAGSNGRGRRALSRRSAMGGGERRNALALRLGRAVEQAGAVALVLAERPWGSGRRGARVVLQRGRVLWGGEGSAPRWLVGFDVRATVERWGGATVHDAVLRFAWERMSPHLSWPHFPTSSASALDRRPTGHGPRTTDHGPPATDHGHFGA